MLSTAPQPKDDDDDDGSEGRGLKGVKVPTFEGNPNKWPYLGGIFSSLIDQNKALSGPIKLAHLNDCVCDQRSKSEM